MFFDAYIKWHRFLIDYWFVRTEKLPAEMDWDKIAKIYDCGRNGERV